MLCLSLLILDGLSSKQLIIYCNFSSGTKLLISVDVAGFPSITVGFILENVTRRKPLFNPTLQLFKHHILAE